MNRLLVLGMNHTTAPLPLRERAAMDDDAVTAAMRMFHERFHCEAIILNTCNRVEFYLARPVHGHPRVEELREVVCDLTGITPAELEGHIYERVDRAGAEHLFRVACSLDSMVVGEDQILAQVRRAYEQARQAGSTGVVLNGLFQRAIACGREVRKSTAIAEGRVSIASVAVQYAQQIFEEFSGKTVLCIGAGKMASLVLRHLSELKPGKMIIANRDPERAAPLAERYHAEITSLDALPDALVKADIVLSSTYAEHAIVTRKMFDAVNRQRRFRPIFFIDIALPRDIEQSVGDVDNVYLYNVDDLQLVVDQTHESRNAAVAQAEGLANERLDEYSRWLRSREVGPLIDALYAKYHAIALDEVKRTAAKMNGDAGDEAQMEELARRIVNKLLHDPVQALRNAEGPNLHGSSNQYLHAMSQLFRVETDEAEAPDASPGDRQRGGDR